MWYIIKTDYYKEREAISDLLQLDSIQDIYFPNPRQERTETDETACCELKTSIFSPVINGILFAYVPDSDLLKADLNASGYFLRKNKRYELEREREQVAGNAHLFSLENYSGSLDDMLRHAQISDEEIYRYKVCIEQCASHTDDIKIIGKDFAELASENDTVMITDGPFMGQTGVIKQVKSHGVKDRCFFYGLGGYCVQLSGVRRYGYIVVKESAKGTKAQLPNTWRYIDFLLGKLQASFFADTASAALRHILELYNKVKDVEKCQALLLNEAKVQRTEAESRELALQAVWLQQITDDELGALKSLSRFFQSADNSVAFGLADLIPDMPLRPFLTPTSGVEIPKNTNFVLFPHNGFVELIYRVNLKEEFQKAENYPSLGIIDAKEGRYTEDGKLKGKMRKARPFHLSAKEYIYYVHVALRDSEDGKGVTAMVNWGEFAHRYLSLNAEGREAFLADLLAKGYHETHSLLSEAERRASVDATTGFCQSVSLLDEGITHSGFACNIPDVKLENLMAQYERSMKAKKLPGLSVEFSIPSPVLNLIQRCIPSAVELWQRQRLLEWRHLVQRYVLLHNMPL